MASYTCKLHAQTAPANCEHLWDALADRARKLIAAADCARICKLFSRIALARYTCVLLLQIAPANCTKLVDFASKLRSERAWKLRS